MKQLGVVHALVIGFAVGACRSAASHYYTLSAPAGEGAAPASAELQIDVLPVEIPADVDRTQMVVRRSAGEVTPVDTRSWIAPLGMEVHRAISDDLAHALGVREISGVTGTPGILTYRIKLAIHRFESVLNEHARIDAVWTVREAAGAALTCSSSVTEPAVGSYDDLAVAHQKALQKIAAEIATAVRGGGAKCP